MQVARKGSLFHQDATPHGGAMDHNLIGVDDAAQGFLSVEEVLSWSTTAPESERRQEAKKNARASGSSVKLTHLDQLLHLGDTGGSPDQHDLVDVGLLQASVLQYIGQRRECLAEEVAVQLLELGAGERC